MTVDTGATNTIVRRDVVSRWRVKPTDRKMVLVTATGETTPVYGETTLDIMLGRKSIRHRVLVADIMDEVILGLDFLRDHGIIVDVGSSVLHIGNEEVVMSPPEEAKCVVQQVVLKKDVLLPARTEGDVLVEFGVAGGKVGLVEPTYDRVSHKGLLIGRTLVHADGQPVYVRTANISDYDQKIRKGTTIGTYTPVSWVASMDAREEESSKAAPTAKHLPVALQELVKDCSQGLDEQQTDKLKRLLAEYQHVFSLSDNDYGRTNLLKHRIETGDSRPIKQVPRRAPLAKQGEMDELVQEMRQQGIIEPSQSPWSSPVVMVKKKDGSTRFCVDYRRMNDVTKKDSYPLPRIDDTLDTVAGSQWFSTLDLRSGYWQVELHPDDKEKTAFSTGNGLWQFNVMPFGLCNAPATFERLMETVLRGLDWRTCLVYLDDIIVLGKTFDEHLRNLGEVFRKLGAANLKLSPKKCRLFKKEVKFLGHVVSVDGVGTDPEKTEAIRNWPAPEDKHQLRSFLGLCTYYRRFVKGFADIAKPMHRLTEDKQPYDWTKTCQDSFDKLKELLCSAPILTYPTVGSKFIVDTDASNTGIGGVLSQIEHGEERVVAYFSKTLSKAERNYCVTRRELLAIVKTIEQFHKYLYGQEFLIRTDHASLKWLLQFKNLEGQLARWMVRLQEYNFQIEHRSGRTHLNADGLSRRPCSRECKHCTKHEESDEVVPTGCHRTRVEPDVAQGSEGWETCQINDADLKVIIDWKKRGIRPLWGEVSSMSVPVKSYWAQWDTLIFENEVLKRVWESPDGKLKILQVIVPKSRISEVLKEVHNGVSGGHLGINKTVAKIRERFYWLRCRMDVLDWCHRCNDCAQSKGPKTRSRGRMRQYNVGAPFERIAIDVAGPFPTSDQGNKYILVATDYFSKWPEAFAIPNQEAVTVAEVLVNNIFCRYGVPLELHSDQGRNFESNVFQNVCRLLGIRKTRTTPLHPQSDGMVERFNRTLENHLRIVVNEHQTDWDRHLPLFLLAYRSAVHETTGQTPASVIFGRELRLPVDLMFGHPVERPVQVDDYCSQLASRLEAIHNAARDRLRLESDRMKTRYDVRANSAGFQAGDYVWLYNPARKIGRSPKLQRNWEGPYRVITRLNDVVYRIQRSVRSKAKIVHLDRLTPYQGDATVDL
jgi:RNase H-like domain found in reverse transcriptase/Reverse transcriptase (RNA-dependent DNA polymerase)/Integrase zinc binding domain/Integrase core domain/gag-polyprotein putative aspartyl protease